MELLVLGTQYLHLFRKGDLKQEVFVANKDIGFIKKGQKAQIRVDAFPFTNMEN